MKQVRIIKCSQGTMLVWELTTRTLKTMTYDDLLNSIEDQSIKVINITMLEMYIEDLKELSLLKQSLEN